MLQSQETMSVAELKDKLLCWIKEQRQWLHRHLKHGHHQGEGNGHQNSDNRVPGLQPVVYEVPSMEESCSLTEEKDCPKVSRRLQTSTASSSRAEGS